jgi:HEAT repeat protein
MAGSQNELSSEEKIAALKRLIESEDAFFDNQSTFETYLSDPDPEVRILAIQGLWDYPDPALIDTLMDIAKSDPDHDVRNRAIAGLGRYVYEGEMADYDYDWGSLETTMREDELPEQSYRRVVAFLLDMVRDPSAPLNARRFSIEALGFATEPEITDVVERAYYDPQAEMKASALFAMGRSGLARWEAYVLAELDNPDQRIQLEAVRAAGELFLDEATSVLIHLARSAPDQAVRHEAIWALGHATSPEAWELLDDVAQDPTLDEETRQLAEAALEEYEMLQAMDENDDGFLGDDDIVGEDSGGNGYFSEW